MTARENESALLDRCVGIALGASDVHDGREANVYRLAGMVIQSRYPDAARALLAASESYFARHPTDRLPSAEVVRHGWVSNLPRLRDMLSLRLAVRH